MEAAGGAGARVEPRAAEGESIIAGLGAMGTDMVVINEAILVVLVDCFF